MIWASAALAATVEVAKGEDLQAALDAANDGDVVIIATDFSPSAAYVEIRDKDLVIKGDGGQAQVPPIHAYDGSLTLRQLRIAEGGNGIWPVLVLVDGGTESALLDRVELYDNAERAAFEAMSGTLDVEIRSSVFEANGGDGGMQLAYASLVVDNTSFLDNDNWGQGGAIWTKGATSVEVKWSNFERNTAGDDGGALAFTDGGGAPVTILGSTFRDNASEASGGDVFVEGHSLQMRYVASLDGVAVDGGFLYSVEASELQLDDLDIHRPKAADAGGAIAIEDCTSVRLARSLICGATNASASGFVGAAVHVDHGNTVNLTMENVIFQGTAGSTNSPAFWLIGAHLDVRNSTFASNDWNHVVTGQALESLHVENVLVDDQSTFLNYDEVFGEISGSHNLFHDITSTPFEPREEIDPVLWTGDPYVVADDPVFVTGYDPADCSTLPRLGDGSPAIDAGNGLDPDKSPADIGAFGGSNSADLFDWPERPESPDTGLEDTADTAPGGDSEPERDSTTDTATPAASTRWLGGGCRGGAASGLLLVVAGLIAATGRRRIG